MKFMDKTYYIKKIIGAIIFSVIYTLVFLKSQALSTPLFIKNGMIFLVLTIAIDMITHSASSLFKRKE